jgi:DNA repair exonuclease SbcCD nuclease subunit
MNQPQEEDVLRVLHTADWHLGMAFVKFTEAQRTLLRRARLEAVEAALLAANRERVDAVLCAGDLFDDVAPRADVWHALATALQKTPSERPIFLLPGNHDPLTPDSIWRNPKFRGELPSWVHVVDREPFECTLAGGAVLYAVPCCSKAGQSDPTAKIPNREPGDNRIRIGMVHGSTFDLAGAHVDFPIARDAALERKLDYLAIGDTHGFRLVPPERLVPPTVYPGTPEQTAFDERLPGHVVVVGFNVRREARVREIRVGRWTWERVDISDMRELRALARRDLRNRVLHLTLDLRLDRATFDEAEAILADLEGGDTKPGAVGVLRLDRQGLVLEASTPADWADFAEPIQQAAERLRVLAASPTTKASAERAMIHLYDLARKTS